MAASSTWTEVSASPFEWEREALSFIRDRFPDRDPYRAWSNFEFIDHDGSINEVDLLAFSPRGAFLVEIKSWPDRTEGDGGTWSRLLKNGRKRALDNPLLLTNRKAKRLKSLLENQARKQGENPKQIPFIQPLVFLSHPDVTVDLDRAGRNGVCLRDVEDGSPPGGLPGIVQALTKITDRDKARRTYRPLSTKDAQRFAAALDAIGIRETTKHRRVGDWELGELLEEGEGWQEFAAARSDAPDSYRRVRVFGAGSALDRELVSAAAKREFQSLEPIEHPGILTPNDLVEAEQGPALIYAANPTATRLDHFLEASGTRLTIEQRISMVRQIGEALAHAHSHDLTHRALRPSSVLVTDPDAETIELKLRDWHVAHKTTAETQHTGTLTAHADLLIEQGADVYLAPEAGRTRSGPHLDVFGLGALAFYIFSGQPPAPSLIDREAHLRQHKGLDLAAVMDGAGDAQRLCILDATAPEVSKRTPSVRAFLANLDDTEAELAGEEGTEGDPTSATKGETLAGYEVKGRLGRGGTAIAYLVADGDDERVLKVAASRSNNDRIREEGDVLKKVRDPAVVAMFRDDISVSGHAALLIEFAGKETLADRIRRDGPPGLELLERWGEDLIRAVASLETQGVAHRDIKPDNIGIRKRPPNDQLRLALFDFSLSRAPLEALSAGTPDYVDPFIREAKRGKWDLAAERFALAMTLHEMATGQLPRWGDGMSDPLTIDAEVELEQALFDPGVASQLCAFFRQALARESTERFDTAEDMLRAWRECFAGAAQPEQAELDKEARDAAFASSNPATAVGELPFSARARSALRGAGIATAGDLIASSVFELRSLTGVGASTRDEIVEGYERLRDRLATDEPPDVQSLDMLSRQLVPTKGWDPADLALLRDYLGLEGATWPSVAELEATMGTSRAKIEEVIGRGRERWYKTLKSVRRLCDEIAELLEEGVLLPVAMLEEAVLATRGAVTQGEDRRRIAAACVRAAVDAESYKEAPRFELARGENLVVVSHAERLDSGTALSYVEALGEGLGSLVVDQPIPIERASETLRAVDAPEQARELPAERLCRLATQANSSIAINDRGEVYPVGMKAKTAVENCSGSLIITGGKPLTIDEISSRVEARYPDAEELPARPALDQLLDQIGLEWDPTSSTYGPSETTESVTRLTRGSTTDFGPEQRDRLSERLSRARNRFLALTTHTRYATRAEQRLAALEGASFVSLDALLIRHMKDVAAENEANWEAIIGVDTDGETGKDWGVLERVAKEAAERAREELLETPGTVILSRAGLLARFGCMDLIQDLRRQIENGSADHSLEGLWLLVPTDSKDARPMIDGKPVPVLDENEWAHVPRQWITSPTP